MENVQNNQIPFLRIENISVKRGRRTIFRNLDWTLSLDPGKVLVILGPSGTGKSTFLETLAGTLSSTSGRILLEGTDITPIPAHKRRVGMVFQERTLFPGTVEENISFPLEIRKTSESEKKDLISELLKIIGLQGYKEKNVAQLSGGERQRVELARALAAKPKILCLDEPLSNVDSWSRKELGPKIIFWIHEASPHTRVIYVTHLTEEALSLGDFISVVVQSNTNGETLSFLTSPRPPLDIYTNPIHLTEAILTGEFNTTVLTAVPRKDFVLPTDPMLVINSDAAKLIIGVRAKASKITDRTDEGYVQFAGEVLRITPSDGPFRIECRTFFSAPFLSYRDTLAPIKIGERVNIAISLDDLFFFDENGTRVDVQLKLVS